MNSSCGLTACVEQSAAGKDLQDELEKLFKKRNRVQDTAKAIDYPLAADLDEQPFSARDVLGKAVAGWEHCCAVTKRISETLNAPLYSIDVHTMGQELESWYAFLHASAS